jgi:16S rRNA (cytidine1402-2'-O)-methyltransferase
MPDKGTLYLLPNFLSENQDASVVSNSVTEIIKNLEYFIVENVRTSRRFISSLQIGIDIELLSFQVLDKRFDESQIEKLFEPIFSGNDMGLQSEAGLPCIADPGNVAVAYAHRHRITVTPLIGASSIILGLISSGFNGQSFTFHGYLPIDKRERIRKIKEIELKVNKTGYTQLFMEAPYRNDEVLKTLIDHLNPQTLIYVGADITGESSMNMTLSAKDWKKNPPKLHKIPTIFGIGKS